MNDNSIKMDRHVDPIVYKHAQEVNGLKIEIGELRGKLQKAEEFKELNKTYKNTIDRMCNTQRKDKADKAWMANRIKELEIQLEEEFG